MVRAKISDKYIALVIRIEVTPKWSGYCQPRRWRHYDFYDSPNFVVSQSTPQLLGL